MRPTIFITTRSEEHTSELQSHLNLVCRLLLGKKRSWSDPAGGGITGATAGCREQRVRRARDHRGPVPPTRRWPLRDALHFFPLLFFNDTATTEIYTLSLHDALLI